MADEQVTETVDETAADAAVDSGEQAADKDTGTILDNAADDVADAGNDDTGEVSESDWRTAMAGEDKAALKRLQRFADPANFYKSYKSLESKLKSGEYTKALPEDADEKTVAVWRKENGIPEEAKGYLEKLELPNGMVLGEDDKPVAESFAERAHELNWTPKQYADAVGWYYEQQDAIRQQQEEADDKFKQESEDELRSVWEGADYRRNLTAVRNMMAGWPVGLSDAIMAGRTADGRLIGDDPRVLQAFAQMALDLNPAATLVPHAGADTGKAMDERLSELQGWMKAAKGSDDWKKYWKDEKAQAEYRDLLNAQEKMKSRAA